jgi:hypothetical protein
MTTAVVQLAENAWTLVAAGPGTYEIALRETGKIKLREAASLPSGEPAKYDDYWPLVHDIVKTTSLAAGENLYAWPSSNAQYVSVDAIASENHIGQVGGHVARSSASFTRPADTLVYASGDLVANSITAGSAVPLTFSLARAAGKGGMIRRARLRKTGASIANAAFRLHLYSALPVVANGDNGAWLSDKAANYVGHLDFVLDKAFSDGAAGNAVPAVGSEIIFTADTYYGLLEARGGYTPASAEVFNLDLETIQN